MGCVGDLFTWRRGDICERLDQAICNLEWANKFPRVVIINGEHVHSDHRPLILDTDYFDSNLFNRRNGRVRQFEAKMAERRYC